MRSSRDRESLRTWLAISVPVVALVAVVVVGALGESPTPSPATTPAAVLAVASASSAAPASSPVRPSPTPIVGGPCVAAPIAFDADLFDLTGAWAGDDGGIYYVRQQGDLIWWNGMSSRDLPPDRLGRDWNNVGRGEIQDDLTIDADWIDVPRGGIGGGGTVTLRIGADAAGTIEITKLRETGTGRGDSRWTPCTPGFPS
jgi:adhesin HecA-like repeat protein